MEMQTENANVYTLKIKGIWGRNRKEKFTTVRLATALDGAAEPEVRALLAKAEGAINALGLKRGRWAVVKRPIEIKTYSDGEKVEVHTFFNDVQLFEGGL